MPVKRPVRFSIFHPPAGDSPLTAFGLLLCGVIVLALQDALVKLISTETSFWQFQTLRSFGNLTFIIGLSVSAGGLRLMVPANWRPVYLRGLVLAICMFFFFSGAPFLSVAQMAAGLYTYPLFVSILAGPILGERVGAWRIAALLVGAGGAFLMLDPLSSAFSPVQILPIIAGFFYACNILILRRHCRQESPLALTTAVATLFIISGLAGILFLTINPAAPASVASMPFVAVGWPELSLLVLVTAFGCSALNLSGNICLARAYQTADSSWLAPLEFIYLLFAAVWGRVIFTHWPEPQAIAGMALIAGAGMLTAWREQRRQKQTA
jgi:drug/metabolite transporter (DMT)-like permease